MSFIDRDADYLDFADYLAEYVNPQREYTPMIGGGMRISPMIGDPLLTAYGVSPEYRTLVDWSGKVSGYGIPSLPEQPFYAGTDIPAGPPRPGPLTDINGTFTGLGAYGGPTGVIGSFSAGLPAPPTNLPGPEVDMPAPPAPQAPPGPGMEIGIAALREAMQQRQEQMAVPEAPFNQMQYGAAVPPGAPPVTMLDAALPETAPPSMRGFAPQGPPAAPPAFSPDRVAQAFSMLGPVEQAQPYPVGAVEQTELAPPADAPMAAAPAAPAARELSAQIEAAMQAQIDPFATGNILARTPAYDYDEFAQVPAEYGAPPAAPLGNMALNANLGMAAPPAAPLGSMTMLDNAQMALAAPGGFPAPPGIPGGLPGIPDAPENFPAPPAPPSPIDLSGPLGMNQFAGLPQVELSPPVSAEEQQRIDDVMDASFPSWGETLPDALSEMAAYSPNQSYSIPGGGQVDIKLSPGMSPELQNLDPRTETFEQAMTRALGPEAYPGQTFEDRMNNVLQETYNTYQNEQLGVMQTMPGLAAPKAPAGWSQAMLAPLTPEQQFAPLAPAAPLSAPPAPPAPIDESLRQIGMTPPAAPMGPTAARLAEIAALAPPAAPTPVTAQPFPASPVTEIAPPPAPPDLAPLPAPSIAPPEVVAQTVAPPAPAVDTAALVEAARAQLTQPPAAAPAVAAPTPVEQAFQTAPLAAPAPPAALAPDPFAGLYQDIAPPAPPTPEVPAPSLTQVSPALTPEQVAAAIAEQAPPAPPTPVAAFDVNLQQTLPAAPPAPPAPEFGFPAPPAPPAPSFAPPAPPAPQLEAPVAPLPGPPAAPGVAPAPGGVPNPEVADPFDSVQVGYEVGQPLYDGGPVAINKAGDFESRILGLDGGNSLGINMTSSITRPEFGEIATQVADAARTATDTLGNIFGGPPSPPSGPDLSGGYSPPGGTDITGIDGMSPPGGDLGFSGPLGELSDGYSDAFAGGGYTDMGGAFDGTDMGGSFDPDDSDDHGW